MEYEKMLHKGSVAEKLLRHLEEKAYGI